MLETNYERTFRKLQMQFGRVADAINTYQYDRLAAESDDLLDACQAQGVSSSYAHWQIAVAASGLRDYELAFAHINLATSLDPLLDSFWISYESIVASTREALCNPSLAPDDPSIRKLYELLSRENLATVTCHLVFAKHLCATDKQNEAFDLLQSLARLNPSNLEVENALVRLAAGRHASLPSADDFPALGIANA